MQQLSLPHLVNLFLKAESNGKGDGERVDRVGSIAHELSVSGERHSPHPLVTRSLLALQDNSTMLMEASRGGHTKVVQLLIDFPNSISHLLPVVAQPHPSVAGGTTGGAGEVTTGGPFLEGDPHSLTMGLTVVPSSDPQTSLVLNANQALFNDMGELCVHQFVSHRGYFQLVFMQLLIFVIPRFISR